MNPPMQLSTCDPLFDPSAPVLVNGFPYYPATRVLDAAQAGLRCTELSPARRAHVVSRLLLTTDAFVLDDAIGEAG